MILDDGLATPTMFEHLGLRAEKATPSFLDQPGLGGGRDLHSRLLKRMLAEKPKCCLPASPSRSRASRDETTTGSAPLYLRAKEASSPSRDQRQRRGHSSSKFDNLYAAASRCRRQSAAAPTDGWSGKVAMGRGLRRRRQGPRPPRSATPLPRAGLGGRSDLRAPGRDEGYEVTYDGRCRAAADIFVTATATRRHHPRHTCGDKVPAGRSSATSATSTRDPGRGLKNLKVAEHQAAGTTRSSSPTATPHHPH